MRWAEGRSQGWGFDSPSPWLPVRAIPSMPSTAAGSGDGEFDGPSGIAIDQQDMLYIVDSRNHRVQKFTKDGEFLSQWGSLGSAEGQFNSPWGLTVDQEGDVYVADHKNHRVQKFTADGTFVTQFGRYGTGKGQLNRPTDVAVDPDG